MASTAKATKSALARRLIDFRQLNGWSTTLLSEQTGGAVSRATIANVEADRKKDLTVRELLALSWALGVPPVALALPVSSPAETYQLFESDEVGAEPGAGVSVAELALWFTSPADFSVKGIHRDVAPITQAGTVTRERLRVVGELVVEQERAAHLSERLRSGDESKDWEQLLAETRRDLEALSARARGLGISVD